MEEFHDGENAINHFEIFFFLFLDIWKRISFRNTEPTGNRKETAGKQRNFKK